MSDTALDLGTVLEAPDAASWLTTHLRARFDAWLEEAPLDGEPHVVELDGVLADDRALLRGIHDGLVADGVPPPAAATYLADWFAGIVAGAVGYGLATAGAGFLVHDTGRFGGLRFHLHPAGSWPYRVDLPARAAVTADHAWAGHGAVDVLATSDAVVRRTVRALAEAVSPIIDACHRLARVGRAGLWNEVGDSLGAAVAHQDHVPVTPVMLAVLGAAVAVPGVPWKARPRLGFAPSPVLGQVHVAQKGGCCLAYTRNPDTAPSYDDPDLGPGERAYLQRFPVRPDEPRYCTTCSFRDPDDSAARQVFWAERRAVT